ncbi:hypothetical protein L1987_38603 [Smallanthus sonchifolius]|uniref:Uncharacterized protein n=1 Tax=Smallanthus sonchifolius TaxID=185202 RepID=A0ACB9HM66_9ASTR|nr:hypothetical protein L1987_38603 [Smallanthus sonchifolius]
MAWIVEKLEEALEHQHQRYRLKDILSATNNFSDENLIAEVLCGRRPMITNEGVQEELDKIIDPNLRKQMDTESLALFTNIAHNCLRQQLVHRPTMDHIVKELEEVLELKWKHDANLEHSIVADEGTSSNNLK